MTLSYCNGWLGAGHGISCFTLMLGLIWHDVSRHNMLYYLARKVCGDDDAAWYVMLYCTSWKHGILMPCRIMIWKHGNN